MSLNETTNIRALLIIEVIGRPPEHLTETLENMIKSIGEEKGAKIINKKINEPTELQNEKGFYANFAEIEIELEKVHHLALIAVKYMPAHIDIMSPDTLVIDNNRWNEIFNEILRKLHGYDEITKITMLQRAELERKLKELEDEKKE